MRIRARAFAVAVIIIPIDNYWVLMMEKVREAPRPIYLFRTLGSVYAAALGWDAVGWPHARERAFGRLVGQPGGADRLCRLLRHAIASVRSPA